MQLIDDRRSRSKMLAVITRFLLVVFLLPSLILARPVSEKPNIIVIYTDDHGWPDIGAVGVYPDLKTPHIDVLAKGGARALSGPRPRRSACPHEQACSWASRRIVLAWSPTESRWMALTRN